jgi:hypothetical protein
MAVYDAWNWGYHAQVLGERVGRQIRHGFRLACVAVAQSGLNLARGCE